MNSPLLIDVKMDSIRKFDQLSAALGNKPIIDINDGTGHPANFDGVEYALVWKPDSQLFERLPDLKVLFSVGAGVDHIFQASNIPDVPIVRFVDDTLTTRMSEWICWQCLMHLRQQRGYDHLQSEHQWRELDQPQANEITVGIMGMGMLGRDAAQKLKILGFSVVGWSRSGKPIKDVEMHSASELNAFLSKTDFLIGLLPLTAETTGIFNRNVFTKLRRGHEIPSPVFINAGRGKSQVEDDIIACLKDGTLQGVSLDVFETEPLPAKSPLWDFENAYITPHSAAVSDVEALGRYVANQIKRFEAGLELENIVDHKRGY